MWAWASAMLAPSTEGVTVLRIVESRRGVFVERPARPWARVAGLVLALFFALVSVASFTRRPWAPLAVQIVVLLGLALLFWLDRAGYAFKRYRVKALVELRDVPEGTLIVVLDTHNARHEVITSPAIAESVRDAVLGDAD